MIGGGMKKVMVGVGVVGMLIIGWLYPYQFYIANATDTSIEIYATAPRCLASSTVRLAPRENGFDRPLSVSSDCAQWYLHVKQVEGNGTFVFSMPAYGNDRFYWVITQKGQGTIDSHLISPIFKTVGTGSQGQRTTPIDLSASEIRDAINKFIPF